MQTEDEVRLPLHHFYADGRSVPKSVIVTFHYLAGASSAQETSRLTHLEWLACESDLQVAVEALVNITT